MGANFILRDVFQAGLDLYLRSRSLPFFHLKAAHAIRQCQTAELGGHVKKCPQGHVLKAWYNSCRHRACPLCAWAKINLWLDKVRQRLLPVDHFHITCTLPAELRVFWQFNHKIVGDLFFKCVRLGIFEVLRDPKLLGAKPGLLMNLHTWSRSLWTHIHIHCLVTGGGVTADGRWKNRRLDKLLPTQLLAGKVRKRMIKALNRLLDQGRLELPIDMDRFQARKLIQRAKRKKWIVDRRERYAHGEGVAAYLARYVRGGPLKNQRLLGIDQDKRTVTFRVSRKGEKFLQMQLDVREFIGRILLHVPPIGYRVVRTCGLYHHHYAQLREACREQLGGGQPQLDIEPPPAADGDEPEEEQWTLEEDYCPVCGCLLEVEAIPRAPPPLELAKYLGPIP